MQARVLTPPMFMAQDPQMPSRHERLNVRVGSISFLILIKASKIIGPHLFRSTVYSCIFGLSPGCSGFHRYTANFLALTGLASAWVWAPRAWKGLRKNKIPKWLKPWGEKKDYYQNENGSLRSTSWMDGQDAGCQLKRLLRQCCHGFASDFQTVFSFTEIFLEDGPDLNLLFCKRRDRADCCITGFQVLQSGILGRIWP